MSKAEDFLLRAGIAERRMNAAIRKREFFRELAEKVTSPMDGERVSGGSSVDSHESALISYIQANEDVSRLTQEYTDTVSEISDKIAEMDSQILGEMLENRYLRHMNITEIANNLYRTRNWVYTNLDRALMQLESVLNR